MAGEVLLRRRSRKISNRPIPKRGQVKVMIAVGLVQLCAALLSGAGLPVVFQGSYWWRRSSRQST
ncbi:hypothetical protein HPP92_013624 [Vanilla planifolia]|uniref:Uncharacterized protein n=1 Tax=Vanilla planifolia TaxID=51239 RepID=A0A835UYK7_VANPL|nr:hypothetical protein HPP92_014061 [Vanilla planifolia]KAG0478905.1 hypothetical protein HPP92_013624 [Vanilla planifolia]